MVRAGASFARLRDQLGASPLLGDAGLGGDQLTDAIGEILVVSDGIDMLAYANRR